MKLCPICGRRYIRVTVNASGNLLYVHDEVFVDRVKHVEGCVITDDTEAWGVKMKPGRERPP